MSQDNTTQGEAVNSTAETTVNATEQVDTPVQEQEKSIGEVMETSESPKTIGLDKFLDIKKENKQLKKEMKDLAERIANGGDTDVSDDLAELAKEHNVDEAFLAKLTKNITAKAEKSLEERLNAKLEPLNQKEKQARVDEVFAKTFKQTLERNPEYDGIANADVIKTLAMNPANAKKTLSQILEEAYGGAVQGKPTVETAKHGGGKDTKVDFAKAKSDSAYFKQVMENPAMRAEYNKKTLDDVMSYL